MNITVTGRHLDVTPALKNYVEGRVNHLARYSTSATEASVTLTVEKYRHQAEIEVNVNGVLIQAKEETPEMYASIDQAVEKIERQLKKHKDRLHNHRARPEPLNGEEAATEAVKPGRELRRERPALNAMTPEEAVGSLERGADPCLLFRHAATSQVNAVYRRPDGTVAWIDPTP
jgi:putative sigma-54 modulation protein